MSDQLYERDVLAWSEQQADLLRRLHAGEGVNEAVDWANVIEEVQDVGGSILRATTSLIQQAMVHLLKLYAWPDSSSQGHWLDEAAAFLDDAERYFSPSMRQRIELEPLYARALRRVVRASDASGQPRPLPAHCPFTLDALLEGEIDSLLAQIESAAPV